MREQRIDIKDGKAVLVITETTEQEIESEKEIDAVIGEIETMIDNANRRILEVNDEVINLEKQIKEWQVNIEAFENQRAEVKAMLPEPKAEGVE